MLGSDIHRLLAPCGQDFVLFTVLSSVPRMVSQHGKCAITIGFNEWMGILEANHHNHKSWLLISSVFSHMFFSPLCFYIRCFFLGQAGRGKTLTNGITDSISPSSGNQLTLYSWSQLPCVRTLRQPVESCTWWGTEGSSQTTNASNHVSELGSRFPSPCQALRQLPSQSIARMQPCVRSQTQTIQLSCS